VSIKVRLERVREERVETTNFEQTNKMFLFVKTEALLKVHCSEFSDTNLVMIPISRNVSSQIAHILSVISWHIQKSHE
jgi:hypothetical protein